MGPILGVESSLNLVQARQDLEGSQKQLQAQQESSSAGQAKLDARIKEFKATVRCVPLVDEYEGAGRCIITGEPVDRRVVIAKAY